MGQQQRAAVARTRPSSIPKVLLADEPTSFQDDAHTEIVVCGRCGWRPTAVRPYLSPRTDWVTGSAADRVVELRSIA